MVDDLWVEQMKEPASKGKPAGRTRAEGETGCIGWSGNLGGPDADPGGPALEVESREAPTIPRRSRTSWQAACIEKLRVNINGAEQGMFIKGTNRSNPVLLWVSGGRGCRTTSWREQYPAGLEDLFTVVWWDQRGTGLSYDPDIPPANMTVEQFIADTLAVTDYLRERFDQDKIYLLGHSWGSFIGIQVAARAPERYQAYIGMAQMTHQLRSEALAYDYMLAAYRDRGDLGMVRALRRRTRQHGRRHAPGLSRRARQGHAPSGNRDHPRHGVGDH